MRSENRSRRAVEDGSMAESVRAAACATYVRFCRRLILRSTQKKGGFVYSCSHPTCGTFATRWSRTSKEGPILGVTSDTCFKLLRGDSDILLSDPGSASTIARLGLIALVRRLSRVEWTPTYSTGIASLGQFVLPQHRQT